MGEMTWRDRLWAWWAIRTSRAHAEMAAGRWRLVDQAPQLQIVPTEEESGHPVSRTTEVYRSHREGCRNGRTGRHRVAVRLRPQVEASRPCRPLRRAAVLGAGVVEIQNQRRDSRRSHFARRGHPIRHRGERMSAEEPAPYGNLLPIPPDELATLAELERRLTRRAWVKRLGPGLYRVRLMERGREVRRIHRPTRRQCARIGLAWVDEDTPVEEKP